MFGVCLSAQPPGVPEICRKSISSCVVSGGEQIFIFGKNFLKDTVVVFQQNGAKTQPIWEEKVLPDKDSLQPVSGSAYSSTFMLSKIQFLWVCPLAFY